MLRARIGTFSLALAIVGMAVSTGCAQGMRSTGGSLDQDIAFIRSQSFATAESLEKLVKANTETLAQLSRLEESLRLASGSAEDYNYRIDAINKRLDSIDAQLADLKENIRIASAARQESPGGADLADLKIQLEKIRIQIDSLVSISGGTPAAEQPATQPAQSEQQSNPAALATAPAPHDSPSTTGSAADFATPDDLYKTGFRHYLKGEFDLAIESFGKYLEKYPDTEQSDNAQYWIAESKFNKKEYRAAIEDFDALIRKYPMSNKAPAAIYKTAACYAELGDKESERLALEKIVTAYPGTPEARAASNRLQGIETQPAAAQPVPEPEPPAGPLPQGGR